MRAQDVLTMVDLANQTGLWVVAIGLYEEKGSVASTRNAGGQRRFMRIDIRRLWFILIAEQLGVTIEQIRQQLLSLPLGRTPNQSDQTKMSHGFRKELGARIDLLMRLRDNLDNCIGCGCLSAHTCTLYNPTDRAALKGQGPRYLIGDKPEP